MCKLIALFHNPINGDIKVYDLQSHANTEKHLELNRAIWNEGHYLPDGEIELRLKDTDRITKQECEERFKQQFPTFISFFNWCTDNKSSIS